MGLKAGIYSDTGRNSCGQVYTPNLANQPDGTIAERDVGLHGHVDQDITLDFAEWGFDLIKVDACGIRDRTPGRRSRPSCSEQSIAYPPAWSLPPCAAMNMATADRQ
jgi:hypothetical protein